jgi:hypothetical protein
MGAVYLPSLKDLQKVLRCSDEELRQFGRKMSETVIAGSIEIWRQNAHRTERGTNGEANELIEIEIEEVEKAEMTTREEEGRINSEEEWEMESESETEPNEGRNQEEIDELLSDEREREGEDSEDGREFGAEMRARTRSDSDEMTENGTAIDSDVNGQVTRVQIPREPDEGREEHNGNDQRNHAGQKHREYNQEAAAEMNEIESDGFESDSLDVRRVIGEVDNPGDDDSEERDEYWFGME